MGVGDIQSFRLRKAIGGSRLPASQQLRRRAQGMRASQPHQIEAQVATDFRSGGSCETSETSKLRYFESPKLRHSRNSRPPTQAVGGHPRQKRRTWAARDAQHARAGLSELVGSQSPQSQIAAKVPTAFRSYKNAETATGRNFATSGTPGSLSLPKLRIRRDVGIYRW